MWSQHEMRISGPTLASGTCTDVGDHLARLVALAGIMNQHERTSQPVGKGINSVVQASHRTVVVLIGIDRQGAIKGINDYDPKPAWLERSKVLPKSVQVLQASAQVLDEHALGDPFECDSSSHCHFRNAVGRSFGVQFV